MNASSLKLTSIAAALALTSSLAGTIVSPNIAMAADMLADETYEYTEVEFGTGWYLRGDIGGGLGNVTVDANFVSGDVDLGNPITVSVAAGYTYAEGIRAEFAFNQFSNMAFSSRDSASNCGSEDHDSDPLTAAIPVTGDCFTSANADANASSLMANIYADLGTYFGLRPYIGAGAGAAYVSWNNFSVNEFCSGSSPTDCGTSGGVGLNTRYSGTYVTEETLTWAANAMMGVSYEVSRGVNLDLGYRFTYLGEAGVARAADNAGNVQDFEIGNTAIHEVRLGLRYEIW